MFKLRKEHLEAFEAQVVNTFAVRVLAHVKAVWPAESAEVGDPALREIVRGAIERAAVLGFTIEYDIVRFVDLSFILCRDFDTNPLSSWVRVVLSDRKLAPGAKMDTLYQRMESEFALIEKRKAGKP